MICHRCLRLSRSSLTSSLRGFTTTSISRTPQPVFTTPIVPKTRPVDLPISIVPAGKVLNGLNYTKGRDDPIALEESEYPAWLWRCLDAKVEDIGEGNAGDEFSKSKKLRRKAAKSQRKLEERLAASGEVIEQKIPITKQTIDLVASEEAREELTEAMRRERRKEIKNQNFLKSM